MAATLWTSATFWTHHFPTELQVLATPAFTLRESDRVEVPIEKLLHKLLRRLEEEKHSKRRHKDISDVTLYLRLVKYNLISYK